MYQKTSPKGEPRTWFSHLKMHPGGFSGPLGSKTPPHGPKTPPNYDFLLICVPSGLICRRFLVHNFKKFTMFLWCAFGNAFFQQNIGTLEMKQTSGLARGRHSWHGGGVAEGNWILQTIQENMVASLSKSSFSYPII